MTLLTGTILLTLTALPLKQVAPEPCRTVTDETVALFSEAIEILVAEPRKREDAEPENAHAALAKYLQLKKKDLALLRQRAAQLELSDSAKKKCEEYAFKRFDAPLARLYAVSAFYQRRQATLRLLGDHFLP